MTNHPGNIGLIRYLIPVPFLVLLVSCAATYVTSDWNVSALARAQPSDIRIENTAPSGIELLRTGQLEFVIQDQQGNVISRNIYALRQLSSRTGASGAVAVVHALRPADYTRFAAQQSDLKETLGAGQWNLDIITETEACRLAAVALGEGVMTERIWDAANNSTIRNLVATRQETIYRHEALAYCA